MAAPSNESEDSQWSLTDHGKRAEMNIQENPYDIDSWGVLMREAQSTATIRSRHLFDRLVKQFPTSARYWRAYIDQEIKHRNFEQVEKLFQQCLMDILHIDLWRCYILYIKETKCLLPNYRDKLRQAYEFTLDHIGLDFHSSFIWTEYIEFLQQDNPQGSYAENQKIQSIRKTFQRAVSSPKIGIEQFWKEYNLFEQSVNKMAAKKMTDSYGKAYSCAKRATHEYENVTRGLIRGATPVPPQGTIQELQQLQIWHQYLNWEKSNPLRTEEQAIVIKRVLFAYNQCLLCFCYCPDIWYGAISYLQKMCETQDSRSSQQWLRDMEELFIHAINGPMSDSLIINFAYADFEESRHQKDKAESIYNSLLIKQDVDSTLVYIQYMNFARRTNGIKVARTIFKRAREDSRCGYQAYVAAALLEYYNTKDKEIAFRVFELGMKKFANNVGFMTAYIEYLSHLNEDNNTRVLFEKALSSVPIEQTSNIWRKFCSFEVRVGDLASVCKIEKRRGLILRNQEINNYESMLLVDRYSYLDLLPCTGLELKAMNYHQSMSNSGNNILSNSDQNSVNSTAIGIMNNDNRNKEHNRQFVKPDVKQMVHFKPSTLSGIGMNAIPGGHFPLPSAIANLMALIPPPDCFQGPFVIIEELTDVIINSSIPELASTPLGGIVSGQKRQRDDQDIIGEEGGLAPPSNDIYISRQQKRVHNIIS